MTLTILRIARGVATLVIIAALTGFDGVRANHFILPCGSDCIPRWVPTGSLNTARSYHTATLLQDGKVLVVGGQGPNTLDSAELYDPATGTWSVTGHMSRPRVDHTATLLRSGRVLVAGGESPDFGGTATAEIYDPATGTWSPTGNMITIRSGHAATLLQDGRVLVAGGYNTDIIQSAELYDPGTGNWSATGNLNFARYWHSMTLLQNGEVLVARGSDDGDLASTLYSAELYDPLSGKWRVVADSNGGSVAHTATLLPNGKVLITGGNAGGIGGDHVLAISELFDPATESWSRTGDLLARRYGHAATLLPTGDVLISGGSDQIGHYPDLQYINLATAERFDATAATWGSAADLSSARYGHTATLLLDGNVLAAGGSISGPNYPELASAELYVNSSAALGSTSPVANYQGMWASPNPAEAGWGINFTHQGDIIFASWFTYDASGKPLWMSMTAQQQNDGSFTGAIDLTSGSPFSAVPYDPMHVAHNTVGTGRLVFSDANNGTFSYTLNGIPQVKALARFVFAAPVPACTFNSALAATQTGNYQDMWVVPNLAEPGWGINLTHQGDIIFASWFIYDANGAPFWVSATLTKTAAGTYTGALDATTGPPFSSVPFDSSQVTHATVGNAVVTFTDGNNGTSTYTLNGVSQTKPLTRFVFRAPGTVCE
jgi:N-acetylneuraminic acid mutarotase